MTSTVRSSGPRFLPDDLRPKLQKAVLDGRRVAEEAVDAALRVAGLGSSAESVVPDPHDMSLKARLLRELGALGGDRARLVEEAAYTQWHRVLFARFLLENDLLIDPTVQIAISIEECEDLAQGVPDVADGWELAARFTEQLLPGVFRPGSALLELTIAPEARASLRGVVESIPTVTFGTEDALGWTYQYWQARRKDEVNASEVKIGGAELPAVTQLFTEPYMVEFLVHNTLGAWWAQLYPQSPLVQEFTFLRRDDEGKACVGSFAEWPVDIAEVTVIDPCCGSGHFLVSVLDLMTRMRMEVEGVSAAQAGDAVLRDNLRGLELDARCIQIAQFNVALHAWKAGGYRALPPMQLACTGISVKGRLENWLPLAEGNVRIEGALSKLHELLADAEHFGSLINPIRGVGGDLLTAELDEVMPALAQALESESKNIFASAWGQDVLDAWAAVRMLAERYWLVVTNVPYLTRQKQDQRIRELLDTKYAIAKGDLAFAFVVRGHELAMNSGDVAVVLPESWRYLGAHKKFREWLLDRNYIRLHASLGTGAFRAISGEVVNVGLQISSRRRNEPGTLGVIELEGGATVEEKAVGLVHGEVSMTTAADQKRNPDARIIIGLDHSLPLLSEFASSLWGLRTADNPRFVRQFWELPLTPSRTWAWFQGSVSETVEFGGRSRVLRWCEGGGDLQEFARLGLASLQGQGAWGREGIAVTLSGGLPVTRYTGEMFANSLAALWPHDPALLPAIWAFCSSPEFSKAVRKLDSKPIVTNQTILKVPFDVDRWTAVSERDAQSKRACCSDHTQWTFDGHPRSSVNPVHVAVARLVGYRWPAQFNDDGEPVPDELDDYADDDGIVCLPSVHGEPPAADRLRELLVAAYGSEWDAVRDQIMARVSPSGKTMDGWLRAKADGFFAQHCKEFSNRPFVWQVSDGAPGGFSALINYHKLDRASLGKLIHTYLNDWINQQRQKSEQGERGAEARYVAAINLREKLQHIAEGTNGYDVYVRWKRDRFLQLDAPPPWDPDLDDGVRMNIRPFVKADVLHVNLRSKVKWHKADDGKDPDGSARINDLYYPDYGG